MLAEHAQSNTLIFILKPTDNTCFLKQPLDAPRIIDIQESLERI